LGFRNIVVSDIERARNLWSKPLDLDPQPIMETESWESTQMSFRGLPSTGKAKLSFFKLKHTVLEFIQPIDGSSTWRNFYEKHREGINYIASVIDNADESWKILPELGGVGGQKDFSYITKGMSSKHTMGCLNGIFCS